MFQAMILLKAYGFYNVAHWRTHKRGMHRLCTTLMHSKNTKGQLFGFAIWTQGITSTGYCFSYSSRPLLMTYVCLCDVYLFVSLSSF